MPRKRSGSWAPFLPSVRLRWTYLFRGPDERIESRAQAADDLLLVVRAGDYHARWIQKGVEQHLDASVGDVVHWPAGLSHVEWSDPQPLIQIIRIDWWWLRNRVVLPRLIHDRHHLITDLAEAMLLLRGTGDAEYWTFGPAYLQAILAECARLSGRRADDLRGEMVRYLDAQINLPGRVTSQTLARHLSMERHTLTRHYRQQTGRTPMRDARRMRVEHAVNMIRTTTLPFKEIAARCQFYDPPHLCRLIQRYYQTTPGAMRQSAHLSGPPV